MEQRQVGKPGRRKGLGLFKEMKRNQCGWREVGGGRERSVKTRLFRLGRTTLKSWWLTRSAVPGEGGRHGCGVL